MSKSTLLYGGMLALLGVGLWAIISAGRHLQAPLALAGTWEPADQAGSHALSFTLSQSGRFLRIQFKGRRAFGLYWESEGAEPSGTRLIRLRGDDQSVVVHAPVANQLAARAECRFEFSGALDGSWTALRSAGAEILNAGKTQ